jgi:hypothetical protein
LGVQRQPLLLEAMTQQLLYHLLLDLMPCILTALPGSHAVKHCKPCSGRSVLMLSGSQEKIC